VLQDAAKTGFGVFKIQAEEGFVHEDPAVLRWWEEQPDEEESQVAECLVSGEQLPIARTHQKIRGVEGAKGQGATIVGFNAPAYESYGKTQSNNAPVSLRVAFRYVAALNALLDGPRRAKHRIRVGKTTVAFWTDRPSVGEDIFALFASDGSVLRDDIADEGVRVRLEAFLRALRNGREAYGELSDDPENTPFFLLGLSPNAARISVRFFHQGTLASLLDNLRSHHRDISVVPRRDSDAEFPSMWMLLRQTAREAKDIPDALTAPLLEAVVTGVRYPAALYSAVLRRIRADQQVEYLRACVIKGYLNRNCKLEVTMALDQERTDPPYRLGRLFAALEKTQEDTLGAKLGATIRDTFYSSASATPGAVFPRLLRTYQHHLSKLEGGRRVVREKLVQTIVEPLREFPAHLDLSGQGLFAIGYYHQRQDFFTKKEAPREADPAEQES